MDGQSGNYLGLSKRDLYAVTKINRVIIPIACFLVGFINYPLNVPYIILAFVSISLVYSSAAVLNDIFDIEIDAITNPERPIPSRKLGINTAYFMLLLLFSSGLFLAFVTGYYISRPYFIFIGLIAFILGVLYSSLLSKNFVTGCGVLGASHGVLPYISGVYLFGSFTSNVFLTSLMIFIVLFLTYNIKDFKDIYGDIKHRKTLPVIFGSKRAKKIIFAIFALLLPISIVSNIFLGLSYIQLFLSSVSWIILMILGFSLFRSSEKKEYETILDIYRYAMVLYIISFAF